MLGGLYNLNKSVTRLERDSQSVSQYGLRAQATPVPRRRLRLPPSRLRLLPHDVSSRTLLPTMQYLILTISVADSYFDYL